MHGCSGRLVRVRECQHAASDQLVRLQFLKAFKRNDKGMAVGCLKFIAHLCNQQVAHEALALEIMVLLLDNPTNDSVEIALEFARDVAALLEDTSPQSFTMSVLLALSSPGWSQLTAASMCISTQPRFQYANVSASCVHCRSVSMQRLPTSGN